MCGTACINLPVQVDLANQAGHFGKHEQDDSLFFDGSSGPLRLGSTSRSNASQHSALPELDLVLIDWNMPKMDGIVFVVAVRNDSRYDR